MKWCKVTVSFNLRTVCLVWPPPCVWQRCPLSCKEQASQLSINWGLMLLQHGLHVGGLDCSGVRVLLTVENLLATFLCLCRAGTQLVAGTGDLGAILRCLWAVFAIGLQVQFSLKLITLPVAMFLWCF